MKKVFSKLFSAIGRFCHDMVVKNKRARLERVMLIVIFAVMIKFMLVHLGEDIPNTYLTLFFGVIVYVFTLKSRNTYEKVKKVA